MSLTDWLEQGWLRKHKPSQKEIDNLLGIVDRDICDASDLNPVAVLILKCTLEYPQKYGRSQWVAPKRKEESRREGLFDIETYVAINPLLEAVKEWGNWVLKETEREIGRFYPKDANGSIPVGHI